MSDTHAAHHPDAPLHRLLRALPGPARRGYEWLAEPGRTWLRVPLSLLLIGGGFLGFLPVLGFWMVPLGLLLLARDVPALHRPTVRALGVVQNWWDRFRRYRERRNGRLGAKK